MSDSEYKLIISHSWEDQSGSSLPTRELNMKTFVSHKRNGQYSNPRHHAQPVLA